MAQHARVVVIGGGVVGVATLYQLARKGWSDVALLERKELTSGSTWHAAGLLPLFNMSYSVGQIHKYSVNLYRTLAEETGLDVGLRIVGNIRLAMTPDRMDEYRQYAGVARTIGVNVEFLTPDEVHDIWPLAVTDGLVGAMRHPDDGYIQPADLTQALARGARRGGASIHRQTCVTGIEQTPGGEWLIRTDEGDWIAEHVVSATGNFARRTGAMVGLDVPVLPVQHQYIVTETHPDILARHERGLPELGVLRESDGSWYMREEAGGLLLGPYEKGAPACYLDGPDPESEYELFNDDIDRLMPHIESAIRRVPVFEELGIKRVYNGAIAYTPDGSPIVGPAWDKRNFWLNEGHSFGITAAAGAGWQLAEWIVEGEPTIDMLGVDPRRFGDYATGAYLKAKNEEAYANVFTVHYPDEERPAGRPLRTAPCYGRMREPGRGVRPEVRLGAAQLVRPRRRRAGRPLVVSPFTLVRARGRRVPQCPRQRRPARHDRVRQGSVSGPGCQRRSWTVRSQSPAQAGPHRPVPRAQHPGRRALRVHHPSRGRGSLLPGVGWRLPAAGSRLAAAPDADRRLGPVREPDRRDGRAGRGRTEVPGTPVARLRHRPFQRPRSAGSPARMRPSASRPRSFCGSTSSANSAGRSTTASSTRTRSSTR